jgi:FkbM family methyltransferase
MGFSVAALRPGIWTAALALRCGTSDGDVRMFNIASILPPLPRLKIVDVGAMSIGEGEEPYSRLMKAVPCEVIGFEPVAAECDKLNQEHHEGRRYLPYFIGDGAPHTFHECNFPMTSSLLEPNTALLTKFQNLENFVRVVKTYPVKTQRLDDIAETAGVDFLKLDVQGGEMLVLQGAVERLQSALVVQTEVEFVPLYRDQPLFADIDAQLRAQGFLLHRMGATGRTFKPLIANNDTNAMMSQWLWGDAIYVRDFMTFESMLPVGLLKLAAILHENYDSFDLAAVALETHDRVTGSRLQPGYIQALVRGTGG